MIWLPANIAVPSIGTSPFEAGRDTELPSWNLRIVLTGVYAPKPAPEQRRSMILLEHSASSAVYIYILPIHHRQAGADTSVPAAIFPPVEASK